MKYANQEYWERQDELKKARKDFANEIISELEALKQDIKTQLQSAGFDDTRLKLDTRLEAIEQIIEILRNK